jgi:hypothetical protein
LLVFFVGQHQSVIIDCQAHDMPNSQGLLALPFLTAATWCSWIQYSRLAGFSPLRTWRPWWQCAGRLIPAGWFGGLGLYAPGIYRFVNLLLPQLFEFFNYLFINLYLGFDFRLMSFKRKLVFILILYGCTKMSGKFDHTYLSKIFQ